MDSTPQSKLQPNASDIALPDDITCIIEKFCLEITISNFRKEVFPELKNNILYSANKRYNTHERYYWDNCGCYHHYYHDCYHSISDPYPPISPHIKKFTYITHLPIYSDRDGLNKLAKRPFIRYRLHLDGNILTQKVIRFLDKMQTEIYNYTKINMENLTFIKDYDNLNYD